MHDGGSACITSYTVLNQLLWSIRRTKQISASKTLIETHAVSDGMAAPVAMPAADPVVGAAATLMKQRLASARKIRDCTFGDLDKTIALHKIPQLGNPAATYGAPNFMLALALCCYTEFWGQLIEDSDSPSSAKCFNAFFARMGGNYAALLSVMSRFTATFVASRSQLFGVEEPYHQLAGRGLRG